MRQRKYSRSRALRRMLLVICEGLSEAVYVEYLKTYFRLPIAVKVKVPGNKINLRLVKQYVKDISVGPDDVIDVVYMYDADVDDVVERLSALPGIKILSNPCFELWLLLHHVELKKETSSESIIKTLSGCNDVWKDYKKGKLSLKQQEFLSRSMDRAIDNAKKLYWPKNPSTNIYEFIEVLKRNQ
ncbi:MAG: RloB domain-containing protein [Muribaculaceae bacterium]|nr:RloB domain-containing protein [Muribaculaceae bacterium]